jgi:ABC-2 type transport system permease protein
MFKTIRRYAGMYAALWRNSVIREMGFKSNFILWIFVEMLWFVMQIGFIAVIYQHTDRIATWTKWEVVLLVGVSHLVQQLFTAFFFTNLTQLSDLIRTGKLDFMLLLPVNSRFLVSFRHVDLGGFVNAASAFAVIVYSIRQLHVVPGPAQWLTFPIFAVAAIVIHYSLMLILASTSFFTVRAQGIVWGYYNLFNISRLPDAVFRGFFKVFFTFAIPMLLVANVPAKLLLQRLSSLREALFLFLMAAGCLALSECVWRFSLKHYTSASS